MMTNLLEAELTVRVKDWVALEPMPLAAVMVIGLALKVPRTIAMTLGGVCCFTLRMVAVALHWNLPKVMAH